MRFENVKLHAEALGNEAVLDWVIVARPNAGRRHRQTSLRPQSSENIGKDHIRSINLMEGRMADNNEELGVKACLNNVDFRKVLMNVGQARCRTSAKSRKHWMISSSPSKAMLTSRQRLK